MTDRSKQHCDHECVCDDFHPEYDPDYQEICNNKDCEHDTRTHTPAALATEPKPLRYSGVTVFTPPELSRHDAAIREQVLTEVIQDIEKMIDAEQERTIEGMYSKEGITKLGILAYVSEHFKSLRGGATDEGGERR